MAQGVEFEEDKFTYARKVPGSIGGTGFREQQYVPNGSEPKMIQWLMRHGYAKTPMAGNMILLGVVVANILIAYFVYSNFL